MLYDALTKPQQERMDAAMTREWDKWNEFGVTKFLSEKQLIDIMKHNPHQRIVGSDGEGHPGQAGIQGRVRRARMSGRQELRQDRGPHGMERRFLQQRLRTAGLPRVRCSVSVSPVEWNREVVVFCEYRTEIRLQERSQGKCLWQLTGSIYRSRPAGRACLVCALQESARSCWVCGVKAGTIVFYCLPGPDGLEAMAHTRVDDFLIAFSNASKTCKDALKHHVRTLHVKQQSGTVVHCGRTIPRMRVTCGETGKVNAGSRVFEH